MGKEWDLHPPTEDFGHVGAIWEKGRKLPRVDTELAALADTYIRDSTVRNRMELMEDALRFYLGFLTSKKRRITCSAGTMQDSENRLARMDFEDTYKYQKRET